MLLSIIGGLMLTLLLVGMAYHGTATTSTQAFPTWFKDYEGRDTLLPGGLKVNPADFNPLDSITVTAGADAAQNANTVELDAPLTRAIPQGSILNFGGGAYAELTAPAAEGDDELTVANLPAAITEGDTATYRGVNAPGIAAGTLIGRTYAEQEAGTPCGPFADGDDEVYLVLHDVADLMRTPWVTAIQPGARIATNHLPGWADRPAAEKAAIRATYTAIHGSA